MFIRFSVFSALSTTALVMSLAGPVAAVSSTAVAAHHVVGGSVTIGNPAAARDVVMDPSWLEGQTEQVTDGIVPGVTVALKSDHGVWATAAGTARRGTGTPLTPQARVRVGGITMPMVATLVMQLVEEGVVTLDGTTVGEVVPGAVKPSHERVTLRQLLSHTSGIPDYVAVFENSFTSAAQVPEAVGRVYGEDELLGWVEHAQWNPPGSAFSHSNTNYLLVGMMLKEITQMELPVLFAERIAQPAGMTSTVYPVDAGVPQPGAWEYLYERTNNEDHWYDVTHTHPSLMRAAGAVIGTPQDMNRFWRALLKGELVSMQSVEEMLTPVVGSERQSVQYGLGVELRQVFCSAVVRSTMVVGHVGHTVGTNSASYATTDGSFAASMSATLNNVSEGSPTSVSAEWDTLLEGFRSGFCPKPHQPTHISGGTKTAPANATKRSAA